MKNHFLSFKAFLMTVNLSMWLTLTGCYQEVQDEQVSSSVSSNLSVITRSVNSGVVHYPLIIYAFDEKGVCKAEKSINNDDEAVKFNLPEGNYRITAIAGAKNMVLPKVSNIGSKISTEDGNFSVIPLSMGQADARVSGNSSLTLQMYQQEACVELKLTGLPDDVEDVNISISKQYSKIDFEGTLCDETLSIIPCTKENGIWTTGNVYLLPSSTSNSVFTISITDSSGVQNYGYTYNAELKAGVPYVLNGSFSTGFSINGTIITSGWDNEVVLDFNFGPGINETGGGSSVPDQETPSETISELPESGSIWNGHVVAYTEKLSETSANLMLLSLKEWNKVASGNNETEPYEALSIAESYNEEGLSSWSIPTREEATILRTLYSESNIVIINNILNTIAGTDPMTTKEDNGNNARYLCDDSYFTFTLGGTNSITQAGTKTKYRLRLIKHVPVSLSK